MKFWRALLLLGLGLTVGSGCSGLLPTPLPTPLPPEALPTLAALTLQARASLTPPASPPSRTLPATQASATPPPPTREGPATPSLPAPPSPSLTFTEGLPATITLPIPLPQTLSPTPAPPIPDARLQIYRLGELSKVISPLEVTIRMDVAEGRALRVELYGEDGRLLARTLRTSQRPTWPYTRLDLTLEFEIGGVGELGRLVVSMEDAFGRLVEVNSVNLILLSSGQNEINPATALKQRIVIEEPLPQILVQGGTLIVSGRALPNRSDQPLRVMILGEDRRILGQRLSGVNLPIPGDYGRFIVEVPYTVSDLTPALVVVYEEGEPLSDIAYLSSVTVFLAP